MKEKIIFNEKIDIPDIVNDKCNMAYEQIRSNAGASPKKIRHTKKATVITIAVAAAIACGIPVAADYIKNAFSFVSNEVYTKNPAMQMDLSPYAEDVNKNSAQTIADITMQSVYCDGENLSIAFALKPTNEELKKMTRITAYITTKLNDTRIKTDPGEMQSTVPINFYASDDGTFYAMQNYQQLSVKENSALDVQISSLKGFDDKHVTWIPDNPNDFYGSGGYMSAETDVFSDKFNFESTVNPDTSNNKLYEVNETQDGITLESVFVTPFKTDIVMTGLSERQSFRVVDNDGNQLEHINFFDGVQTLTSPLTTAKQLNIEVFDLDTDNFPTEYTFTVDIEKGFANKYTVEWDDSDVVYNPPREELEKHWEEENARIEQEIAERVNNAEKIPVNTVVDSEEYITIDETPENYEDAKITVSYKITGSMIDDSANYELMDADRWNWYEEYSDLTPENTKMLIVTYELTNNSDKSGRMCFSGSKIYSKDTKYNAHEPDYMPDRENGGKSSYMFDFEPYETKTITCGYIVPEEYVEVGFYSLTNIKHTYESIEQGLANGNIAVMEIE